MSDTKEPTQEQIREFWEWCGFRARYDGTRLNRLSQWKYPNGDARTKLPIISLSSLFKYAVPKMRYVNIQFSDQYSDVIPQFSATASIRFADNHMWADDDPALALFWALWQVKG